MNQRAEDPYTPLVSKQAPAEAPANEDPVEVTPIGLGFTGEGLIAVAMVAAFAMAAWLIGDNLVFGLFALLLGAALVARRIARKNIQGLRATRRLPVRTRVGQLTPIAYEVATHGGRVAVGIELEDRPGRGVKPLVLLVELPLVKPNQPARVKTHVRFGRRGEHELKTLALQSRYPLGLVRARRRVRAPASVLVHPAEGRVTGLLRARLRGRMLHTSRPTRAYRGDDVLYGVREFRDGDDPRRIHWRSTARRGDLTMTEWRAEEGTEVFIVLGRARGAGAKALVRFERAVSCAATVWRAAQRDQLRARLVLDAGEAPLHSEQRCGLGGGLDALAHVKAQGRRKPEAAIRHVGRVRGRRTIVYVATGPEPEMERAIRSAAGRGGDAILLRCDLKSIRRWVRGVS